MSRFVLTRLSLALVFGLATAALASDPTARTSPHQLRFSDDWITALRQTQASRKLIGEFEARLGLTATTPFHEQGFVSLLEANLDTSPTAEVLVLIGRSEAETTLAVFRREADGWLLAGHVPVHTWYYAPEYGVLPNGLFYTRQLEERGTGIFKESYQFYRLIDGQLLNVLGLPLEARLYGWGMDLNQHLQVRFQALAGPEPRLRVHYDYRFFAGPGDGELSWQSSSELVFLADQVSLDFVWDPLAVRYLPEFSSDTLNALQLRSLETLGDPELFVEAFGPQLRERLQQASPELKRRLTKLLGD